MNFPMPRFCSSIVGCRQKLSVLACGKQFILKVVNPAGLEPAGFTTLGNRENLWEECAREEGQLEPYRVTR